MLTHLQAEGLLERRARTDFGCGEARHLGRVDGRGRLAEREAGRGGHARGTQRAGEKLPAREAGAQQAFGEVFGVGRG